MKPTKKVLSLILALVMVLSLVPYTVFGAGTSTQTDDDFYKIVHLDAGRKYFSPTSIKAIIDEMAEAGYNQLELYLSDNQGFRFALDNMTITTNTGKTYDLTPALGDGYSAGGKYPDYSDKYLTQSEMTDIIAYAKNNGIEIVPCINVPGHMGAILEAFTSFRYKSGNSTSKSSINLENTEAVAFALAITDAYASYFASQGCKFYNLGADEYANDLSTMGFAGLYSSGKYQKFVDFLNSAAQIVIDNGMTPRAFNDGICYNNDTKYAANKAIQVCYWSSGWNGYNVASASTLANAGYDMINTHGDYYWVLGNSDWQCSVSEAKQFNINTFPGPGSTISNPAGAMFCIWCDVANTNGDDGGTAVVADTKDVIAAFATKLPVTETPVINKTVWDGVVSVTAPGLVSMTATKVAVAIEGYNVVAYDVTPMTADGKYTGEGTVTMPLPEGWDDSQVRAFVMENGAPHWRTANADNGNVTFTAPHFSIVGLAAETNDAGDAGSTKTETVTLKVGESTEKNITGENYAGDYNPEPAGIATVMVTGKDKVDATQVETTVSSVSTSGAYYIKSSDGKYLNKSAQWVTNIADAQQWTPSSTTNGYYLSYKNGNTTYYLRYNNGWTTTTRTDRRTQLYFNNGTFYRTRTPDWWQYTYSNPLGQPVTLTTTEGTPASTTITFNGVSAGTTYVTIGDTKYTINVTKKTQNVTVSVNETAEYPDSKASTAVSNNTAVATVSYTGNQLTISGVAVGSTTVETDTTIYNVTVAAEDLSKVTDATIELWITNQRITANNKNTVAVTATAAYGENGIAVKDVVPATGTSGSSGNNVLWKVTALDKRDHEQTTSAGDNESLNGTDFNYIRYFNKTWSYSVDGTTWTDVTNNTQLVAYYLQRTTVTEEVTTDVVDYGVVPHTGHNSSNFVIVDYSVKYESGEEVPSSFPVSGKTMGFHCDPNDENTVHQYNGGYSSTWHNNYRDIAMIRGVETADYEVYMITVTPTSDSKTTGVADNCRYATSYEYAGTEYIAWADTQADLDNSGLPQYSSISGKYRCTVGGDPVVNGLEIFNRHGMKVTYYVRAKVTEDALTVNYVNQKTGENFYNYNIAVQSGTFFNTGIALATPQWKADLMYGSVTNLLGKPQTVSADLSTMPAIGVSYRYSDYTCTGIERSADGKTVTLYYTFNNEHAFVVDFGLPLKISAGDLGIDGDWTSATVTNMKYGTATAVKGQGVTYTPTTTLTGVEQLSLNLTNGSETTTHIIYIYPATTVYYEEGFASMNGFTYGSKGNGNQTTSEAHDVKQSAPAVYGFDAKYAAENAGPSNVTEAVSNAKGDSATFTFTGTGVDIYANCGTSTGWLMVTIKGGNGFAKLYQVNTATGFIDDIDEEYSLPVVSVTGLNHDNYTVTIRHIVPNATALEQQVKLDGFRVYDTLKNNDKANTYYVNDLEDNPSYIELRNEVLAAYYASRSGQCEQVYGDDNGTVVVVNTTTAQGATAENIQTLLTDGPKNELFLKASQKAVFTISTDRMVQIGLKAPNAPTSCKINGTEKNISSSTDMFYTVGKADGSMTVTIENTGNNILSITKIKVCDDPNAALVPMTADDVANALNEPVIDEPTHADATLKVSLVDYTGKVISSTSLTANGVAGETAEFSAEDIRSAAQGALAAGYGFVDLSSVNGASVVYGEDGSVQIQVGKVATLQITYKRLGKVVGTATLTHVQTSGSAKTTFTTQEIKGAAPSGRSVISILGTSVKFGSTAKINATTL